MIYGDSSVRPSLSDSSSCIKVSNKKPIFAALTVIAILGAVLVALSITSFLPPLAGWIGGGIFIASCISMIVLAQSCKNSAPSYSKRDALKFERFKSVVESEIKRIEDKREWESPTIDLYKSLIENLNNSEALQYLVQKFCDNPQYLYDVSYPISGGLIDKTNRNPIIQAIRQNERALENLIKYCSKRDFHRFLAALISDISEQEIVFYIHSTIDDVELFTNLLKKLSELNSEKKCSSTVFNNFIQLIAKELVKKNKKELPNEALRLLRESYNKPYEFIVSDEIKEKNDKKFKQLEEDVLLILNMIELKKI